MTTKFSAKSLATGKIVYGYLVNDDLTRRSFILELGTIVREHYGLLNFFAVEVDPDTVEHFQE